MDITKIILKMLSKLNKVTWIKFSKIGLVRPFEEGELYMDMFSRV